MKCVFYGIMPQAILVPLKCIQCLPYAMKAILYISPQSTAILACRSLVAVLIRTNPVQIWMCEYCSLFLSYTFLWKWPAEINKIWYHKTNAATTFLQLRYLCIHTLLSTLPMYWPLHMALEHKWDCGKSLTQWRHYLYVQQFYVHCKHRI